ncbi:hypothetical protein JCM16303_006882 [Sporobolomyces ruberrimus]
MPATRSLKPLLKFTLVLCLVVVLYRSFVSPFLSTSSLPNLKKDDVQARNAESEGKKRVSWKKETQDGSSRVGGLAGGGGQGGGYLGVGEEVAGTREKQRQMEQENKPLPPPPFNEEERPGRPQVPKDKKKQVQQIVKQVPERVPDWVVANEIERVEDNGEKVLVKPGKKGVRVGKGKGVEKKVSDADTFKQELDKMKQRKQQKQLGGNGKDKDGEDTRDAPSRTVPQDVEFVDEGEKERNMDSKVYHLVDEDDELDSAQRGDSDARMALSGQRKKGPLIQVGGAGNAAGEKAAAVVGGGVAGAVAGAAGAAVDAVKAKGKDKWKGKGWDQRFRKQPGEKDKEDPEGGADAVTEAEGVDKPADSVDASRQNENLAEEESAAPEKLLVQHPLVARFLQQDISHYGGGSSSERSQVAFVDADEEDAPPGRKPKSEDLPLAPGPPEKHNLTVCALVPNEQRFLPEWILYHSLLGVSRFALYDTSLPGAFGGEEIDQLADSMREEGGGGENAPTVEELKAQVAVSNAGREGLDEKGMIRRERVRGLEEWIDKGRVKMFYMKFKNPRATHDVHALMLENCLERFGPTSNWLAHLDVDEFLSLSTPLYGSDEPYSSQQSEAAPDHVYPLHDLLAAPALESALCVPVPELNYRNLGVRELKRSQGVLETQVHRDVLGEVKESSRSSEERGSLPQKTLIRTGFSSDPGVSFSGPHSCELLSAGDESDDGIRDSQGNILASRDGLYHSQNLPIEPLAIAHYVQRDLLDCHSKLSSVADPLSLLPKGRGSVSCEAHYLPSAAELSSPTWRSDPANEDLKTVPLLGSVLEDRRMATSWAGRAAKTIGEAWRKSHERGMRRTSKAEREKLVSRVRHKVEILSY